ncbi:MAG TPA: hypothetical protein VMG12_28455 [Polyangiaceae bacterium]|nr:hypothetical protein [Polyangiaceae bacterium]
MGALSRVRWAPAALAALGWVTCAGTAWGRAEAEVGYTREQTFSAALRYLRVDLAYEVTEKDPDAAYLLFSFAAPELQRKVARGSIEVVQRQRTVRVFVNLPELPTYREEVLKRGLLEKLRTEYGEPVAPEDPPEKAPPKKPDNEPKPPPDAPEGDAPPA